MFEVKAAHLAVLRFGRDVLREVRARLTPARFDLLYALGKRGMRQSDLWRRLNVVRSVVCEMLTALEALGWVKRTRDAQDRRTWVVELTAKGRDVVEQADLRWVTSGDAAVWFDAALSRSPEVDALAKRLELIHGCSALQSRFRRQPKFGGPDLYLWQIEDFCWWLTHPDDPREEGDIPFVA